MFNIDPKTVDGFGTEWTKFDQSELGQAESQIIFRKLLCDFSLG